MMKFLTIALLAFSFLFSPALAADEKLPKWVTDAGPAWQPPAEGVVRDKWAAIEIAHAAWFSLWPSKTRASVDLWQSKMEATLKDGVWEVTTPMTDEVGGSFFIFISQKDGRVLDVVMTQ
jgi:hypothetical protein